MDPKTMKQQFRSILSPKGARHHEGVDRYIHLAHTHARGKPHAFAEPRVKHDHLPEGFVILQAYLQVVLGCPRSEVWRTLSPHEQEVKGAQLGLPTVAQLKEWAAVPPERVRGPRPKDGEALAPLTKTARLYLIVRGDLPTGDQAVQGAHALREFVEHHREEESSWYKASNTLALLAARDEGHLTELLEVLARTKGFAAAPFREPDLQDSLTAVAFSPRAGRLFRGLLPALRASHLVRAVPVRLARAG